MLGDNAAEAETLFKGEPETALIAAILWAFEVCLSTLLSGLGFLFFFFHHTVALSVISWLAIALSGFGLLWYVNRNYGMVFVIFMMESLFKGEPETALIAGIL